MVRVLLRNNVIRTEAPNLPSRKSLIESKQHMDNEQIEDRIKHVFVRELRVADNKCTPEATITDDLGADSLDRVELIMGMEEEFNIVISDQEAEKVLTVNDAIHLVKRCLQEHPTDKIGDGLG